ncbi:hypothetical protein BRDID11004_31930 [Bradyrhizobium diazoefficiens]|uniref:Uncharacterized protein n=1 Tax=Bradyrhizobium diazoefficiens TaxID=1355477 RepID=A0A810ASA3_9BRAD|nr:hypothetical protein F07S3_57340 [Bradyrhizobium diazoefficiens]BCA13585.1 hypothetical protein BDHF08_54320 [Bradyrhizobium diazoefficiens]BCE57995.1 hypothetical protein XF5B_55070 [Bradyrhizobium diazoefficiens]BCE66672.1 hypothetical protein XF6B_54710 [Bradyrhizobium diazoefficiens]BCE74062.1 hypothetical protein XF8B_41730 [Bradyrhizobium diazoefficiens]
MPRSKRRREHLANYRFLVAREARELLPVVGYPGRPIAGRPGRPIAGYPGYGGGYYRPGWGYGAAAVGAAAAAGAYGYYIITTTAAATTTPTAAMFARVNIRTSIKETE